MTLSKLTVEVGDKAAATAAARYPLAQGGAMWLGAQAALDQLGLRRGAEVQAEELANAFQGLHALTGEEVRRPGYVKARGPDGKPLLDEHGEPVPKPVVNSYRMAFSAPKSVSVVWSQAGAELRTQIERAMWESANAALEHVVRTRPVLSNKEPAEGFAAAGALHLTARAAEADAAPAPQLHLHLDLVGVLDAQGRLRTPASAALFKDAAMREAGAVGRAHLAASLERLGFRIEARTGRGERYFEIAGVPQGLIERMSGRAKEVRRWVAEQARERGRELSNREAARGGLHTRRGKGIWSPERIQAVWDAHGREFDFGPEAVERLQQGAAVERHLGRLREEARTAILKAIWQEGPTVSRGTLHAIAAEQMPAGLTPEQVREVVERMKERGDLIALEHDRVTTPAIRERERYVQRVAHAAAREEGERISRRSVRAGIEVAQRSLGGHELDPEQRDAVKQLVAGAGWSCLTGPAGTGKGPVLEAVAEAHRQDGWSVVACAVDNATTERLGQQVGAQALTIAKLLRRVEKGRVKLGERTLIVLDEASKVGLQDWVALARLREAPGVRLLAVGDIQQLGAIELPGMLEVMLKDPAIPSPVVTEVRRHRDPRDPDRPHPWLVEYQQALYRGDAEEAVGVLRRERAIAMHETRADAMRGLVDAWERRRREERIAARDAVLVVYGSNDDVDEVNRMAQERRIAAGELGAVGVPAVDRDYELHQHDVVMMRAGAYEPDDPAQRPVNNGTMGVVRGVDAERDRLLVEFEDPEEGSRLVEIDQRRLRAEYAAEEAERAATKSEPERRIAQLRLAYAGHPFPLQGATFRYVGSLWGHWSQDRLATYSGDTRAKHWLDVQLDGESFDVTMTDEERYEEIARCLKRENERVASILFSEVEAERLAPQVIAAEPVPEPPARTVFRGHRRQLDPLEAYREQFARKRLTRIGDERLTRLAVLAEARAALLRAAGEAELQALAEQGKEALAALDRGAALQVARIERDALIAGTEADRDEQRAAALRAGAEEASGRSRQELVDEADAREREAAAARERLAVLTRDELKLHGEERHPDIWLERHGEAFASGMAAERELTRRTREAAAAAVERGPEPPALEPEVDAGMGL